MPNIFSKFFKKVLSPIFSEELNELSEKRLKVKEQHDALNDYSIKLHEETVRFNGVHSKYCSLLNENNTILEAKENVTTQLRAEKSKVSSLESQLISTESKLVAAERTIESIGVEHKRNLDKFEANLRTVIIQLSHHNAKHRMVSSDMLLHRFKGQFPTWFEENPPVKKENNETL